MGMPKVLTAQMKNSASATALDVLGEVAYDEDGSQFRYVQATAANIAQYDAVTSGGANFTVVSTSAANQFVYGVAQIAVTASYYFWVQISGMCTCKVVAATAAGSPLTSNVAAAGTLGLAVATDVGGTCGVANVTGVAAGSEIYLR